MSIAVGLVVRVVVGVEGRVSVVGDSKSCGGRVQYVHK